MYLYCMQNQTSYLYNSSWIFARHNADKTFTHILLSILHFLPAFFFGNFNQMFLSLHKHIIKLIVLPNKHLVQFFFKENVRYLV